MKRFILLFLMLCGAAYAADDHAELESLPSLSGFVTGPSGAPVFPTDLDFFILSDSIKIITPGDNALPPLGRYSVTVLPNIYRVTFAPPRGSRLKGKVFPRIDLRANVAVNLDVQFEVGTVISGLMRSPIGFIDSVDVDIDSLAGGRVFTPNDKSDAVGTFDVVVPNGEYRIRLDPPLPWRGVVLDSVTVVGDTLLNILFEAGLRFAGNVRDTSGRGIRDIGINLRDQITGAKIVISNNRTQPNGTFAVAVPTGNFELRYSPRPDSRSVAERVPNFQINAPLRRDQVLHQGFFISVTVQDELGAGIPLVDLDILDANTGAVIFTPNDTADENGNLKVPVLPGPYRLRLTPPFATSFDQVIVPSMFISQDTSVTVVLPTVERVQINAKVVDAFGVGVSGVAVKATSRVAQADVFVVNNRSNAAGEIALSIPRGNYDVRFVPALGVALVGVRVQNVTVGQDSSWSSVVLQAGVFADVSVKDQTGRPVSQANLDLVSVPGGLTVFTPRDKTDVDGTAQVVVLPGVYDLEVAAPLNSSLGSVTVPAVDLQSNHSVQVVLPTISARIRTRVVDSSGAGVAGVVVRARREFSSSDEPIQDNVSNSNGDLNFLLPIDTYDIGFVPPVGDHLMAQQMLGVEAVRDSIWNNVLLPTAFLIQVTVKDVNGDPVSNANLNVFRSSKTLEIFTPRDTTNSDGIAQLALVRDRYDIEVLPPASAFLGRGFFTKIDVRADEDLQFVLQPLSQIRGPIFKIIFPNPFSNQTEVKYELIVGSNVILRVYDGLGRRVRELQNGFQPAGPHVVVWDGKNAEGRITASGVYYLHLRTAMGSETRRLTIIR